MVVQLFTSRVVLNTLGVVDYGLYNVVGGIVTMFAFLNGAMVTSTQRYITFELGMGDIERLKKVFTTSIQIHALLSLGIVVLGETIGLWFLFYKMVIPPVRMTAALWVFHLSIVTMVTQIMSVPYNSAIIAHEKMSAFAAISVIEVVLKLLVVYLLLIGNLDKLILYAILMATIQILIRIIYGSYCNNNFSETNLIRVWDIKLIKEMGKFAGWNLIGNVSGILNGQGINILLNIFFGPSINAARAITVQVQTAVRQLAMNFQMALNPQIIKTYAAGSLSEMHQLVYMSSKFSYYLLLIIGFPLFFEAPFVLKLWLQNVPDYTVTFLRMTIILMLIDGTTNPLMTSASATGKVKKYQIVVGVVNLLVFPLSYIALRLGCQPWSVYVVDIIISTIAYISRIIIVGRLIQLRIKEFIRVVIIRVVLTTLLITMIVTPLYYFDLNEIISRWCCLTMCFLIGFLGCFFIGLNKIERTIIFQNMSKLIARKK